MKPRMLPIDIPLDELENELMHTSALLKAYPFLAAEAAEFEAFFPGLEQLVQYEKALKREKFELEARAIVVDDGFNYLCVAIAGSILANNGGNRKAAEYLRYYGDAPPSKLKRPVLGHQLDVMRQWPPSLMQAENPQTLRDFGAQVAELVPKADAVESAIAEWNRKVADFEIGPRKKLVDGVNAARQVLYGKLAEIPIKRPELKLDGQFAHHFFLRSSRSGRSGRMTIAEIEKILLRLEDKKQRYEAMLAQLLEEQEAAERAENDAALAEAEAELAALEEERAQVAERVAALRGSKKKSDK